MAKSPVQNEDKYVLRLPDGMRDRLKNEAERNQRSMNAEIIARLDWSFDGTTPAAKDFQQRMNEALAEAASLRVDKRRLEAQLAGQLPTDERIPAGLLDRIQRAAEVSGRPLSEEIVQALEAAFPPAPRVFDFFQKWMIPISQEQDPEKRRRMVDEANEFAQRYWPGMKVAMKPGADGTEVATLAGEKPRAPARSKRAKPVEGSSE